MNDHPAPAFDGPPAASPGARPTRIRWHIVVLLTFVTALTYVDRMNLSIAGKFIQDEFAFSTLTMGWILSAFVLGYALFQIPGGWLGDRFGPRAVLTAAILWWSALTLATGLVPHLPLRHWIGLVGTFLLVRFLIGVGEAAALPNSNKMVAFWVGDARRGMANSMFLMGIGIGGTLTPVLITRIMQRWGWPMSFYISGAIGIIFAIVWFTYATNRPEQHPRVNAAELQLIHARLLPVRSSSGTAAPASLNPPWQKLLSNGSTWGLMFSYFCEGYPNYIFYTWFFLYLVRARGMTVKQGGIWGAAPFLTVMIMAPLGGWFSDRAVARFGKRLGRRLTAMLGMTCSAVLLTLGAHTAANILAVALLSGAMGCNLFATSTWWATCNDLTQNFSASLSAMMNMWGNIGGFVAPILTAAIATRLGWTQALDFAALITFIGGVLWIFVDADQNLEA